MVLPVLFGTAQAPDLIPFSGQFRQAATAYLTRTPTVTGSRAACTLSTWVKRSATGTRGHMLSGPGSTSVAVEFSPDKLYLAGNMSLYSAGQFLSTTAWYHIVVAITKSAPTRLWVNGVERNFDGTGYQQTGADFNWSGAGEPFFVGIRGSMNFNLAGLLAEHRYIDGQALDASSFGRFMGSNWVPKRYAGSYGVNGWRLEFKDSSNMGKDTSGNGNHFTSSNVIASDQLTDTPTRNGGSQPYPCIPAALT